jgi:hypothetical protein
MQVGERVVCVDDRFPKPLAKYYLNLPIQDKTYTVRAVFIGRGVMHPGPGTDEGEIGLLLEELVNGRDLRHKYKQELGFNSERFRPFCERAARTETEDELVMVKMTPKATPLKEMPLPYSPKPQTDPLGIGQMSFVNFADTQPQACFERNLAERDAADELRRVHALMLTHAWFAPENRAIK